MNLDEGLVQIKTDPDVLKMVDCHKSVESVVLYTVSQEIESDCIPFTHNLPECKKVGHNSRTCPSKKDKGTVSTNAEKTPTTNKKRAAGGARATAASAVDSRAKGVKTIAVSAVNSRAGGSKAVVASSTSVRTSTAPLTIYGGGANSECVVVPTLEKAIQTMQA
ncbi:uncharacterized protein LOC126709138 [Quercus robur]|uniref:uncharacterized protein LOC126709138 n=1 Tax=Quercus robur TaxID=38942 RepID=UPI0021632375|nr:uncharacterized protein LOC126709138 [Quercus robur]